MYSVCICIYQWSRVFDCLRPMNTSPLCLASFHQFSSRAVWLCARPCAARCWSVASLSWRHWEQKRRRCSICWWGTTTSTPRGRLSFAHTCRYSRFGNKWDVKAAAELKPFWRDEEFQSQPGITWLVFITNWLLDSYKSTNVNISIAWYSRYYDTHTILLILYVCMHCGNLIITAVSLF